MSTNMEKVQMVNEIEWLFKELIECEEEDEIPYIHERIAKYQAKLKALL